MLAQKIKYLLILFFSLYELFASFISANITETLVNSLFEVKNFNPFLSFAYSSIAAIFGTDLIRRKKSA